MKNIAATFPWAALGYSLLVAALLAAPFVAPGYVLLQLTIMLTYALAVLGMNLLLGFTGLVCLAQGVFFAVGGYVTSFIVMRYGLSYPVATIIGVLGASVSGLLVALPALRLPGLQLAILTFGIASLFPQLLLKYPEITGGMGGISFERPAVPEWFPAGQDQWLYVVCVCAFAIYALGIRRMLVGDTGRSLRAVRDGPLIAASLGVNATRVRLSVFVISSAGAGLGGALFALSYAYVTPDSFQAFKSIEFLIAAVVGGITSIAGALLGAAFVTFVPEWTSNINVAMGGLIYGATLLAVVLLAPQGIVGLLTLVVDRLRFHRPSAEKPATAHSTS